MEEAKRTVVPLLYHREKLPLNEEPDWATLGAAGWLFVQCWPSALDPSPSGVNIPGPLSPEGFDARTFVFVKTEVVL
jgi:hypothetical protein